MEKKFISIVDFFKLSVFIFEKKIESFILILGQSVWSLLFNFSLWDGGIVTRTWWDCD